MNSKKYNNTKLAIGISETVVSFILILLFVYLSYSTALEKLLAGYTESSYVLLLLFTAVTGAAFTILFLPVSFYTGYILEHKYDLSNQTVGRWITESLKSLAVSVFIAAPVLLFFYYSLVNYGELWWLPFAVFMFLLSVVLAKIVPVFILPLFYKIEPLEDEELIEGIKKLAENAGLKVENVYKFDMSKNTKKGNAAFAGMGKTKRIILGDTLLENADKDEILAVIAHETGHYKKKHIIKNIVIGTLSSFLTLFVIALLYDESLSWFGFESRTRIAALPLLALWSMLISIVTTPVTSGLSRKYEYEADRYSADETGRPGKLASALKKLSRQNLADEDPHPVVEWFFYSHPSIKKRLAALEKYAANRGLEYNTDIQSSYEENDA